MTHKHLYFSLTYSFHNKWPFKDLDDDDFSLVIFLVQ